jgi:hypothetical protein
MFAAMEDFSTATLIGAKQGGNGLSAGAETADQGTEIGACFPDRRLPDQAHVARSGR